jgi:hypothetical protein
MTAILLKGSERRTQIISVFWAVIAVFLPQFLDRLDFLNLNYGSGRTPESKKKKKGSFFLEVDT